MKLRFKLRIDGEQDGGRKAVASCSLVWVSIFRSPRACLGGPRRSHQSLNFNQLILIQNNTLKYPRRYFFVARRGGWAARLPFLKLQWNSGARVRDAPRCGMEERTKGRANGPMTSEAIAARE